MTITINTDAGFYHRDKVGSYAYWVVSDGLLLKGSGVFSDKCKNPLDAELKAMCNAAHILSVCQGFDFSKVRLIVFNRDNINARSGKNGTQPQKKLSSILRKIKDQCHPLVKVDFRHVKAHNGTPDKRSYVNDWCDKQCKAQLRKWNNERIINQ
ncbi:hypothetical protein ACLOAU_14445 [Niabella sp. CJ426]|uniref:hypothetical protein n=1 Tax=Niabella sp. CJ426 TaxID=3393740 RepID=UPI003CFCBAE9